MRSTFSLLLYIDRNKVRVDGTTSVLCRISIDGKITTITTGISCNPKQWNAQKAETADVRTNNRLKEFRKHAERLYDEMLKEQGMVSAELLKNRIAGRRSFLPICSKWEKGNENTMPSVPRKSTPLRPTGVLGITRAISVSSWT